jgi:hypothetical protein
MTNEAAERLAAELRVAGSTQGVFVSVGISSWQDGALRIFFSAPTGHHSIDVANSNEQRVRSHFEGFVRAQSC